MSSKYLIKPKHKGYKSVKSKCISCFCTFWESKSSYKKKQNHFCSMKCYKEFVKKQPFQTQNSYKGVRKVGENKQIYHQNYVKSHPENIAHLKARRYARERNAEGSHTLQEWKDLCEKWGNICCKCRKKKILTKDHIKPLSLGGIDYIINIQPLCRNCNSRKWKKYENHELINN